MKARGFYSWVASGAVLIGCVSAWAEEEEDVPLADVPAAVMTAAMAAVEGIEITEAEIETEDGQRIYELEGTVNGVDYEIEVSPEGEVLSVEADD